MSQQEPASFNDPRFRAAMQRALGGESAPAGLKQRIAASLAAEAAGENQAPPARAGWIGRSAAMRIAASIVALAGIGILANQLRKEFWPARVQPTPPALSSVFLKQMVDRHDVAVAQLSGNTQSPGNDFGAIGANLSSQLGKPVASLNLGDGWAFKSAGLGKVGDMQAAQLLFVRGQTTVSLLSVPAAPGYEPADGQRYDNTVSEHLISGVVKGGVIYCLIAESKDHTLSAAELTSLREKVASLMGAPAESSCMPHEDQTASASPSRS